VISVGVFDPLVTENVSNFYWVLAFRGCQQRKQLVHILTGCLFFRLLFFLGMKSDVLLETVSHYLDGALKPTG